MWRLTVIGILVFASTVLGEASAPKEGTYYKHGQLGIKKMEVNGSRIDLVFKPEDEQFHWCPGIKVQRTKKATVVTFVRCKTSKTCGIDKKAAIGKRMIRTVSIDSGGLDVYVRNGAKKFKRIHKAPKPKGTAEANSKTKTKNVGTHSRPAVLLRPVKSHVPKGRVKNYQIKMSSTG